MSNCDFCDTENCYRVACEYCDVALCYDCAVYEDDSNETMMCIICYNNELDSKEVEQELMDKGIIIK